MEIIAYLAQTHLSTAFNPSVVQLGQSLQSAGVHCGKMSKNYYIKDQAARIQAKQVNFINKSFTPPPAPTAAKVSQDG